MNKHRQSARNKTRRLVWALWGITFTAQVQPALSGPTTTAPSSNAIETKFLRTHEEFLAAAREHPPIGGVYLFPETRKPLSEEQMNVVRRCERLLAESEKDCDAGTYQEAKSKADEAMEASRKLLGQTHFLSISATGARRVYGQYCNMSHEQQLKLQEGDKSRRAAEAAHRRSDFVEGEREAQRAVELREQVLGTQYEELIDVDALTLLGMCQTEGGRHEQADKSFERAIAVLEKSYGKSHPKVAEVLTRLGWLRISEDRAKDAVQVLRAAEAIHNETDGETLNAARTLDHLGSALALIGDPEGAIGKKIRSLMIRESLSGPDSSETGESCSNLAWLYQQLGFQADIVGLRTRALACFEKNLGFGHRYTVTEVSNLARTHEAMGRYDEAVKLYEKFQAKRNEIPQLDDFQWSARLGAAYLYQNRREDADRMFRQVSADLSSAKNDASRKNAAANATVAVRAYAKMHMAEDAATMLEKTVKTLSASGTEVSDRRIITITELGNLKAMLGKQQEALGYLREATDALKKTDPTGQRMFELLVAQLYSHMWANDYDKAEVVCDDALRLTDQPDVQGSPANCAALTLAGKIQTVKKQIDRARFYLDEAAQILEKTKDEKSPIYLSYLIERAALLHAMKKDDEARTVGAEAVQKTRDAMNAHFTMDNELMYLRALKVMVDASEGPRGGSSAADELKKLIDKRRQDRTLVAELRDWPRELGL